MTNGKNGNGSSNGVHKDACDSQSDTTIERPALGRALARRDPEALAAP